MRVLLVLIRSVRWRILVDACVTALSGGLVAFMLAYTTFSTFDRLWYQMGLDYQTVRESDAPGVQGAGVLRSGSLIVIPESLAPDGPGPRSYFGSKSPALRVVPAASVPEVNAILGSSLLSGELTTQGVVIDGAHAALWGIGVGDRVAIPGPRDEDCVVSVSGVSRPYESPVSQDESGDGGQILLAETLCVSEREEAVAEADSRGTWEIYNHGGTTKTQMIVNSLLSPQNYAIAVVLVLVTGLLLWMLVAVRSASRTARAVIEDAMALVRIGVTPRRVRRFARLLSGLSVIVGAVGALSIAKFAMMQIAGFYAQPALLGSIGVLMVLAGGCAQRLMLRGWPTRKNGMNE